MTSFFRLAHSRFFNAATGVFLAMLWGLFAFSHFEAFRHSGDYAYLAFCVAETVAAIFFLVRKVPETVSTDPFDWFIAVGGTFTPLLLRPGGAVIWPAANIVVLVGVGIQFLALLSLSRSFALVAAKRAIKTHGLYSVVRHPMYAGYLLIFTGYALFNASPLNVGLVGLTFLFLFLRVLREERHLSQDEAYRAYKTRVRWRIFPLVY
jgi:protein-S-isoprenylcysteine O-methyltransferase Ste14